ncbi:hypothetical protein FRACYDRAFT_241907 [Fragilariopsis cylindrus CCMP1102]|uniref:Uncharacterized protein n=1 Tax=Fragilariopsis cylindrus CCMP1102 TaxID=635003 RepID=A0A1E7F5V3_9STRA|nr:hypothetical protein FRACYDRAFT_241907 [Fragilariopsis cylindrus CCMP1102]|eukprot:OEU13568.1 hypothetical protein FRACYDRAFT_241907 [Fragilariopsis cylindrus CCMP1102]
MGNHTSTPTISCHLGECDNSKNKTKNLLRPGDTIRGTIKLTVPGVSGNNDDYIKVLRESFDGISIDVAGVEYVVMPPTSSEEEEKEEQHQQQQSRRWLKPTHNVIQLKTSVADFNDKNKNDDSSCGQHYYPFEIELPTNASVSSSSSVPSGILLRHNSSNEEDDDSDNQSLSDDEFSDGGCNDSTNGNKNNNDDSSLSLSFRRKTVIAYRLKAFLRRKPGVRLTTDTDVKCYAE